MSLEEFRIAYPEYDDQADEDILIGLHIETYSHLPWDRFLEVMSKKPAGWWAKKAKEAQKNE